MSVAVIIVNYKTQNETIRFVRSELSKLDDDYSVVVVNNSATDESNRELVEGMEAILVEDCISGFPSKGRFVIPSTENLGFAQGNNLAAKFARDVLNVDYMLFSNNDIVIQQRDSVQAMVAALEKNESIGIIGPKIIGLQGECQSPEPYVKFWDRYVWMYLSTLFMKKEKKIKRFSLDYSKNAEEGFHYRVMGSFFMVRTSDYFMVGGMDPNTFLYAEEVILSERFRKLGKGVYYFPSVCVVHAHGATTKKTIGIQGINKYRLESECYYYHKYMGEPKWKIWLGALFYRILNLVKGHL